MCILFIYCCMSASTYVDNIFMTSETVSWDSFLLTDGHPSTLPTQLPELLNQNQCAKNILCNNVGRWEGRHSKYITGNLEVTLVFLVLPFSSRITGMLATNVF